MSNNYDMDHIRETYGDSILKLAMNIVADKEGEMFLEENKELANISTYDPSEEEIKRIKKTIKRSRLIKSSKNTFHFKRAAAIALVIIGVFSVATISVRAWRIQILNFLISIEPTYTSIRLQENEDQDGQELIVNWTNAYVPTYIPDEFEVESVLCSDTFNRIKFIHTNNDESFFILTDYKSSNSIGLDTENASFVKTIKINDNDGTLIEKDSLVTVGWVLNDHLMVLQGKISTDTALEIAENVKLK